MGRRLVAADPRPCVQCGQLFQPWKVDGRYCSPICRQRAWHGQRLTPIRVLRPDSHDLAWAAGFFDGEGSIGSKTGVTYATSDGQRLRRYLRIDVSQKTDPLLLKLQGIFGVGNIHYQKPRASSSEGFKWVCNGRAAFFVVDQLWPWMGEQKRGDFKRAIKAIRETRHDFIRQPQRGRRVSVL